jgi:pimeloyl-ACP methyl ester carboxylesterase
MKTRTSSDNAHQARPARLLLRLGLLTLLLLSLLLAGAPARASAADVTTYTGSIEGAAYLIEVPANWNGTLLLYSHGIVPPGFPNPARDVGNPATGQYLLAHGYALAGSSYKTTGWAIEDALPDQLALLRKFKSLVGKPRRTIAWGHSLGGMVTAGLAQESPDRFDAALPMCGLLAGGVGLMNSELDRAFAFKTLFAPATDALQVVNITVDPLANLGLAQALRQQAQATAQGRARLALVAAFGPIPGWFDASMPEPNRRDYVAQEQAQFNWLGIAFLPEFWWRAELEARAGGNPSWNTGADYEKLLRRSGHYNEVKALYDQAGLSLKQDLKTLDRAPRIAADPDAVEYLSQNIVFDGRIRIPVLTMHTTADGLVPVQHEQAYANTVRAAGEQHAHLLEQLFVHRAGHCAFTPAEEISALQALIHRLDTGKWGDWTHPQALNDTAEALGPDLNPSPPAFVRFHPGPFLRPFDQRCTHSSTEHSRCPSNDLLLRQGSLTLYSLGELGVEPLGGSRLWDRLKPRLQSVKQTARS